MGGEVAGAVMDVPGNDVRVVALGNAPDRLKSSPNWARPIGTVVGSVGPAPAGSQGRQGLPDG